MNKQIMVPKNYNFLEKEKKRKNLEKKNNNDKNISVILCRLFYCIFDEGYN